MKIYTKTGDDGKTGLLGGKQVSKTHPAIEAVGTLDEVNGLLGLIVSYPIGDVLQEELTSIQNDLFDIGSRIAACLSVTDRVADLPLAQIEKLEQTIDRYQQTLPTLQVFILPSGAPAACHLQVARSVCRRAERRLVELMELPDELKRDFKTELIYLNRLSDLLFVLSRAVNQAENISEREWQVTKLS